MIFVSSSIQAIYQSHKYVWTLFYSSPPYTYFNTILLCQWFLSRIIVQVFWMRNQVLGEHTCIADIFVREACMESHPRFFLFFAFISSSSTLSMHHFLFSRLYWKEIGGKRRNNNFRKMEQDKLERKSLKCSRVLFNSKESEKSLKKVWGIFCVPIKMFDDNWTSLRKLE